MFTAIAIQSFRRFVNKSDPRINTVITVAIKQVLEEVAKATGRTLSDKIRACLAITFEKQTQRMSHDWLIYCEKLACQGK